MRVGNRAGRRWGGVAVIGLAAVALAQPGGGEPPAEKAQPLLSGPTVEPAARAPSLVRAGYDGRIERLEGIQPEVAAVELVDLDEDVQERIAERLEERAAFLDGAVLEHYRTLLELYTAFGGGDQAEVIRLYLEFSSHLQPLFEGGGLGRQLASEMPREARGEYRRLLAEYYAAVARDALEHPEDAQGQAPGTAVEAIRNYRIQLLMEEVGRSLARIVQQKTDEFEEVLAVLRLSPEREGQVRAAVQSFAQDAGLNPTEAQKREIFVRLMGILEPAERQRLLGWVLR